LTASFLMYKKNELVNAEIQFQNQTTQYQLDVVEA